MILWTSNYAKSMEDKINTVLMTFLKRYCNLHPKTRNSLVYFITETVPFTQTLHQRAEAQKIQLEQLKFAFDLKIEDLSVIKKQTKYEILPQIPSKFWSHKIFVKLPANRSYRKYLCVGIVDGYHKRKCKRLEDNPKDFHLEAKEFCICKQCGRKLEQHHSCVKIDTPVRP